MFLSGDSRDHALTVITLDDFGLVTDNVLYGFDDGKERSTGMLLYGVLVRDGTRQWRGQWTEQFEQFTKPVYLRVRVDFENFKK